MSKQEQMVCFFSSSSFKAFLISLDMFFFFFFKTDYEASAREWIQCLLLEQPSGAKEDCGDGPSLRPSAGLWYLIQVKNEKKKKIPLSHVCKFQKWFRDSLFFSSLLFYLLLSLFALFDLCYNHALN